jgi:hypothetical protein
MNTKQIIKMLSQGVKFENKNTQFFISKDYDLFMCEFTKDCKYTKFATIEQFAKRILKFYKTGY